MFNSQRKQLDAFVNFVKSKGLEEYLRTLNWAAFAQGYNGSQYAQNNYDIKLKKWMQECSNDIDYDFFLSDMCPEVFELGNIFKIKSYGVCHFTWDWFFLQTIPLTVPIKILKKWEYFQKKATKIFFTLTLKPNMFWKGLTV